MELRDRVALITGGSRGLGAALARRFAEEGAAVSACARGREALEETAESIRAAVADVRLHTAVVDVSRRAQVEAWLEDSRRRLGPADALVLNASLLGPLEPVETHDPDAWREVIDVNLTGAFLCARAAIPQLRSTRGSLIAVSSGVGDHGRPGWGAYCVSKNGLEALAEMLAGELEEDGVRVNAVDPGAMRTDMRADAYPGEDPGSVPRPYEVTDAFVYLASDRSAGVTGRRIRAAEFDPAAPHQS